MKSSRFLEHARDYLAKRKLCKRAMGFDRRGRMTDPQHGPPRDIVACCSYGAINGVERQFSGKCNAERAIEWLRAAVGARSIASDFNDAPETTKRDVIRAFNRAIKLARAAGE